MVIGLKCMPNKLEMTMRTSPEHGSSSGTGAYLMRFVPIYCVLFCVGKTYRSMNVAIDNQQISNTFPLNIYQPTLV